jgi:hypothetical protein
MTGFYFKTTYNPTVRKYDDEREIKDPTHHESDGVGSV